jgi:hypothetical protein
MRGAASRYQGAVAALAVGKRSFCPLLNCKRDHFTKTGSGRTQRNLII